MKDVKFDKFENHKDYLDELVNRYNNGGTIWLIKRTDTNEFYLPPRMGHVHEIIPCGWSENIHDFVIYNGYLEKEDYEKDIVEGLKYGCSNCGHGGDPIEITKHEFIKN